MVFSQVDKELMLFRVRKIFEILSLLALDVEYYWNKYFILNEVRVVYDFDCTLYKMEPLVFYRMES